MKSYLYWLFSSVFSILSATLCYSECSNYSFYLKVDSGISFSQSANVVAPSPPWNTAIQGYNAKLGDCPIAGLSVGCELFRAVDFEVGISNRSTFKYRKYQTPTAGGSSYTRKFDLSVTPLLFSVNLLGRGIPYCHRCVGLVGKIYPMIGAGFGASNLVITNYRTTGLPPNGYSDPFDSFSSENQYTLRRNFTYTLLAGLEYSYNDRWAVGTGYRWLNAGRFKGPRYQRVSSGAAVDVDGDEWKIRFRSNEWFVEFKIFI